MFLARLELERLAGYEGEYDIDREGSALWTLSLVENSGWLLHWGRSWTPSDQYKLSGVDPAISDALDGILGCRSAEITAGSGPSRCADPGRFGRCFARRDPHLLLAVLHRLACLLRNSADGLRPLSCLAWRRVRSF